VANLHVVPPQGSRYTEDDVYDDNTSQPNVKSRAKVYASGREEDRPGAARSQSMRMAERTAISTALQVVWTGSGLWLIISPEPPGERA
jgi:hypothetical protein